MISLEETTSQLSSGNLFGFLRELTELRRHCKQKGKGSIKIIDGECKVKWSVQNSAQLCGVFWDEHL